MTARPWRPHGRSRRFSNRGSEFALSCARNIYALTNRKLPEAVALADWLSQHARAFGLSEDVVPDLVGPSRLQGVNASDWTRLGKVLAQATSGTAALDRLRTLTVADFSRVHRRTALRRTPTTPRALVPLLEVECRVRIGSRLPVGCAAATAG